MQQKGPAAPTGFVAQPRRLPKAEAAVRVQDFGEIIVKPERDAVQVQAARCTDCGVPFCQTGCPLQNT